MNNYRSTKQIVKVCNYVIVVVKNYQLCYELIEQTSEKVSQLPVGPVPLIVDCSSNFEQREYISSKILELVNNQNIDYKDIAILYRNNKY